MDIKKIIENSFKKAKDKEENKPSHKNQNKTRSETWVKTLSEMLRKNYGNDVTAFNRSIENEEFGLNELLHDICICNTGTVKSQMHNKDLTYISDVHWQVESEFSNDSRSALIDFNKLVLGSAENKLFVGPIVDKKEDFIKVFEKPASACTGNIYIALIPHPRDWCKDQYSIYVWKYKNDQWEIVNG